MTFDQHGGTERMSPEALPRSVASAEGGTGGASEAEAGEPPRRGTGRRRAAGIYGTVVTSAVIAAGGASLPTAALSVGVLVTLLVYWVAEQYAEVLGEQVDRGTFATWQQVRSGLASTWSMVTSSYLPVIALIAARLLHASASTAANIALMVALVLLVLHGVAAGRAAQLHGMRLALVAAIAAVLGGVMILLKDVVLIYLH